MQVLDNNENVKKTYRFKLDPNMINIISDFAQIHQYDDRHDFKEHWKQFTETHETEINTEITRLQQMGYDGNVVNKMFVSARYYFKNKKEKEEEDTHKERKEYIIISKHILNLMDDLINNNKSVKPSILFDTFADKYKESIDREVLQLQHIMNMNDINKKLKKTFKNRYFIINK